MADAGPIDLRRIMTRHKRDGTRMVAVGQRHAGVGGNAQRGRDAGYDFVRDTGVDQRLHLFPAPPEDQRIPALQSNHNVACASVPDH